MIARIWHGWTTAANADSYERLLREEILPGIAARRMAGYKGMKLLRRLPAGDEVEFITIMWFDSLASIRAFTGEDYEVAHVPPAARQVLKRYDERSQHFEVPHESES